MLLHVLLVFVCLPRSMGLFDELEKPEVREIKMRLEEEKAKRVLLQNDVEILMLKVEQLERMMTVHNGVKSGSVTATMRVSFTARLSKSVKLDLHHIIAFDEVLHNQGNGYNANTGIFRAPVSGNYAFVLSLLSKGAGLYQHVSIVKNGTEIGRVFSGDTSSSWPDHGSVTVVTSLTENDEVYAWEVAPPGELYGGSYCTFSGFLL